MVSICISAYWYKCFCKLMATGRIHKWKGASILNFNIINCSPEVVRSYLPNILWERRFLRNNLFNMWRSDTLYSCFKSLWNFHTLILSFELKIQYIYSQYLPMKTFCRSITSKLRSEPTIRWQLYFNFVSQKNHRPPSLLITMYSESAGYVRIHARNKMWHQ